MKDISIALIRNPTTSIAPSMRLVRIGDTIDVYVNGTKVTVLDCDEARRIIRVLDLGTA